MADNLMEELTLLNFPLDDDGDFYLDEPIWADGKSINESLFCTEYLKKHKILFSGGSFFTVDGRVDDETPLRRSIFEELKICAASNVPKKISNVIDLLKLEALEDDFVPETDRIHLANGTLYLDGIFVEGKPEIVRNRLPVSYEPDAPEPSLWLSFLEDLLHKDDIPTLQEFNGRYYSNKLKIYRELMTVDQIRLFTGFSKTAVNGWIANGHLQCLNCIAGNMIPKEYFIDFLCSDWFNADRRKPDRMRKYITDISKSVR